MGGPFGLARVAIPHSKHLFPTCFHLFPFPAVSPSCSIWLSQASDSAHRVTCFQLVSTCFHVQLSPRGAPFGLARVAIPHSSICFQFVSNLFPDPAVFARCSTWPSQGSDSAHRVTCFQLVSTCFHVQLSPRGAQFGLARVAIPHSKHLFPIRFQLVSNLFPYPAVFARCSIWLSDSAHQAICFQFVSTCFHVQLSPPGAPFGLARVAIPLIRLLVSNLFPLVSMSSCHRQVLYLA